MATGPRYKVTFRRRREGRTDYYTRRKLLSGNKVRVVVRRSNKNITIQFVEFCVDGDKTITATSTKELKAIGWEYSCSSIPAAYIVGCLAGKKAIDVGIKYAILDIGMQKIQHGGVLFATVAGMCDAGLDIPHREDVLPSIDRINGKHINKNIENTVISLKKGWKLIE